MTIRCSLLEHNFKHTTIEKQIGDTIKVTKVRQCKRCNRTEEQINNTWHLTTSERYDQQ